MCLLCDLYTLKFVLWVLCLGFNEVCAARFTSNSGIGCHMDPHIVCLLDRVFTNAVICWLAAFVTVDSTVSNFDKILWTRPPRRLCDRRTRQWSEPLFILFIFTFVNKHLVFSFPQFAVYRRSTLYRGALPCGWMICASVARFELHCSHMPKQSKQRQRMLHSAPKHALCECSRWTS